MAGRNEAIAECEFCGNEIFEGEEMYFSDAYWRSVSMCMDCYESLDAHKILEALDFKKETAEVD